MVVGSELSYPGGAELLWWAGVHLEDAGQLHRLGDLTLRLRVREVPSVSMPGITASTTIHTQALALRRCKWLENRAEQRTE
eukprot:scaffold29272_cov64-Phaeocystis_antarctica.AAC.2